MHAWPHLGEGQKWFYSVALSVLADCVIGVTEGTDCTDNTTTVPAAQIKWQPHQPPVPVGIYRHCCQQLINDICIFAILFALCLITLISVNLVAS